MVEAIKTPKARQAVDKEWTKLRDRKVRLLKTVKKKSGILAKSWKDKLETHVGSLMDLCHHKNSENEQHLNKEDWTYKGRVTFRGDVVKNENGQL